MNEPESLFVSRESILAGVGFIASCRLSKDDIFGLTGVGLSPGWPPAKPEHGQKWTPSEMPPPTQEW